MTSVNTLVAERTKAYDAFVAFGSRDDFNPESDNAKYAELKKSVEDLDGKIERAKEADALKAAAAQPAPGQDDQPKVPASIENSPYVKEKSLLLGGIVKMAAIGGGNLFNARQASTEIYGENHPVTKSLVTSTGASGGFLVPPDVMAEIIPLLRAQTVVRGSNPRVIPMPRGNMRIPGQASAATASYGAEGARISASQQSVNAIVASFKKLTALVPVSNDMMRYSEPAVDAFVRDDLVRVMALREDLAFLFGDGTADTPRGFLSFANGWVSKNAGTIGSWSSSANSTAAVNGVDPANSTGGNFITANETPTLATVVPELIGAINKLDQANVPDSNRVWFMNPRSFNYLFGLQNSLGVYVFRDELAQNRLLGYPVKKTTQIGTGYYNANGSNKDCSFVILAEMSEAMIFDSMQLELAVSREGTYVDANGNTRSAFATDETILRAVAEHDFQMRHDASVAVIQNVRWAPTAA